MLEFRNQLQNNTQASSLAKVTQIWCFALKWMQKSDRFKSDHSHFGMVS